MGLMNVRITLGRNREGRSPSTTKGPSRNRVLFKETWQSGEMKRLKRCSDRQSQGEGGVKGHKQKTTLKQWALGYLKRAWHL